MKNTIETPAGCKIAKTEIFDGNLIVTYERDLPESVKDIPNRYFYIINGKVSSSRSKMLQSDDNFSTPERAEAILALGQLLELAAYVGCKKVNVQFDFGIENADLAKDFKEKYSELFKKAKKLL